ncbi:MAG: MarR family transcriptional regulator [Hyphomicrobiaceae bacterium]
MSKLRPPSPATARHIKQHCLCLHTQRAARALARRFDDAFRPLRLTNGQFSLLMSLNRSEPPSLGSTATLLCMDRTTLTALLKPLLRRELVSIAVDATDRRSRRLALTRAGKLLLARALPIWQRVHADVEALLEDGTFLREGLRVLSNGPTRPASCS